MPASYGGQRHLARDFYTTLLFGAASSWSMAASPAFVTAAGWSICAWVRPVDMSSVQSIVTNTVTAGAPQFRVTASRTLEILPRSAASSLLSVATLNKGQWHHCAVTHDAATKRTRLLLDGEIVAENVGTIGGVDFAQPGGALVGSANSATALDRLSFYNREITQAEVRADCYQSAGPVPVARYLFDEGVGTSAVDSLGGSAITHNCTYSADAPTQPIRLPVDWGSIYQAGSSYLTLPTTTTDNLGLALAGVGSFVCSVRVKLTDVQASIDLLRTNTSGVVGLRLQLDGGTNLTATVRAGLDGGVSARATNVSVPLAIGQWVTYSCEATIADGAAGRIRLYRDGILLIDTAADFAGQTAVAWSPVPGGTLGWLGGGTSGANPLPGWLGEIRIDPSMTKAQLRSLVMTGVSGAGEPYLRWTQAIGVGASSPNNGSKAGISAVLTGAAAWSLDAPW